VRNQTVECLREENRCLREKLYQVQELVRMERQEVQVEESEYEPQNYDEAIALCKEWKRCRQPPQWESILWPDLLREMNKIDCNSEESPNFYLTWSADNLKWLCRSSIYPLLRQFDKESFGGAVCGAYLRLKGHKDWADWLCK